ncbi:MAG: sugar porter family MFS transporter [Flavobacteriales bacterium]|nr:sugar porter family MFS transporter [Flavobacteriia bacterium]NCP05604.1 sugar porter family MFS transporter [Flavobacteriales bacterium]PIV95021.1 MAG: MFS transporter [Flavobacteriaceae bacterium CG17_big_fil_post_rev_8_21_14_2_50_33_15]PIY09437.1 MAG: MFS transporter [Flavobacteriaceae bacterium CG_4_10_14_3_um_filter_33_47]PJB19969.1 MAG: MFS transporter [Flavobacteriaceae bacterium CG_4_9_14_3_um_filter_33_16]
MNNKIIIWSITVALAGFLFGFDTVVISGAEQALQKMWGNYELFGSNDNFHGYVVVGSALFGTIFGALLGGFPTNIIGRKNTLIWIGVLYTISALGSGLADNPWVFGFFRFIGGLGVGASTIAAPAYISEIASAKNRGKLVATYQFNIVFGILVAFISNYLISVYVETNSWRWMIGIEALPAFIYTLMVFMVPKSPRWLIIKNRLEEAKGIIKRINPDSNPDEVVSKIIEADKGNPTESVFQKKYKRIILLAFAIALFNQFSGINAFLYYSKRIFVEAGLGDQAALLGSIGIGIANLIFTLIGMYFIDRIGRKKLMIIGSIGYIVSLFFVAFAFFFSWSGIVVPISLFVFIGAHAIGQGAVIWVFISEIFPNHVRSYGQSIGTSTHWILAFIIPASVPLLIAKIGAGAMFLIFAIMMVFQLIWVLYVMPETKGVSLEDLEKELIDES